MVEALGDVVEYPTKIVATEFIRIAVKIFGTTPSIAWDTPLIKKTISLTMGHWFAYMTMNTRAKYINPS